MEPERKIEKLLRLIATKRRDQAGEPMALHSANRRLLQGEVRKQFPKKEDRRSLLWLFRIQPDIGILVAIITIGVLSSLLLPILNGTKSKSNHASKKMPRADDSVAHLPASPPPATAPAIAANEIGYSGTAFEREIKADRSETLSAAFGQDAGGPGVFDGESPRSNELSYQLYNLPRSEPAGSFGGVFNGGALMATNSTVATALNGVPTGKSKLAFASESSQKFAQSRMRESDLSGKMPVLDSFELKQVGGQMRIVDGDGSVYVAGELASADKDELASRTATRAPVPRQNRGGGQNPVIQFSGTNRTLNQSVVFLGTFTFDTNSARLPVATDRAELSEAQEPLLLSGVEGIALVGGSNQFRIQAHSISSTNR
ncbi:MAG: hypothetical protein H7Y43_01550 [Akkermansiaceae bacterium]|nr:hypothetical protein [Verrucomicrobiales bacterium]